MPADGVSGRPRRTWPHPRVTENRTRARLQLVVPCYNEAGRLPEAAFLEAAHQRSDTAFLFVNDGSTDDTAGMLERLCAAGNGNLANGCATVFAATLRAGVGCVACGGE